MKTKTIGEILRSEREFHHFKITDLAQKFRIRPEYLEALEDNQFEKLPAATFVKGYIKSYGTLFGFDHLPLVALLRRDYKESAKGKLVPREFIKPILKRRNLWTPITVSAVVLSSVFLVLISYVVWQWYQLNQPPFLEIISPKDNAFVSAQVEVSGKTDKEASLMVNAQMIELDREGNFQTTVYLPREGINTITVEATNRRAKTNLQQKTVYVRF